MGAPGDRGAALLDVVFTAALVAVLCGIAIPAWNLTRQESVARAGARYVAALLQHARVEALKRNTTVAIRVDPVDLDHIWILVDGDGDGVREADFTSGVDPPIEPARRLSDVTTAVLRVARDITEPDTATPIAAGSDPLRIGPSSILSFTPLGTATGGTLYLAASTGPQMAVRIFGATGRTRVLRFDATSGRWRED